MMKNIIYILLGVFLVACQNELKDGFGYLQLSSVELNKTIIPETKAGGEMTDKLALDILKDGAVIKHVDDWTLLRGQSLLFPTGHYAVKAYSVDKDTTIVGFDAPLFYSGQTEVSVEKDVAKPVEVVCKLAQCMVSVHYTDNFKKSFKAYTCKVANKYGSVDFIQDEDRNAYFPAASITATLSLTNTDDKSFTFPKNITDVKGRYHYKINYDVTNEGTGDFNITVDQTTHNYIVNITVPLTSDADPDLHTGDADAWGLFAYLYGTSDLTTTSDPIVFQYKKVSESEWQSINATLEEDGSYSAKTLKLDFGTDYNYRIACGAKVGSGGIFTTESYQEIPNLNFDTWNSGYPNADGNNSYWATGNEGVQTAGKSNNTVPVDGAEAYRGKAVKMTTLTGIMVAKSAAGNLFIGNFSTNIWKPANSVTFGRPYTGARPLKLTGYYKYTPMPINEGTKPGNLTTDQCNIYIRLWDAGGKEIGFGEFVGTEEVTSYTQFSIDINYTDLKAKPAKITIVATSSRYGGEFEGSKVVGQVGGGSTLWVDEFELIYFK